MQFSAVVLALAFGGASAFMPVRHSARLTARPGTADVSRLPPILDPSLPSLSVDAAPAAGASTEVYLYFPPPPPRPVVWSPRIPNYHLFGFLIVLSVDVWSQDEPWFPDAVATIVEPTYVTETIGCPPLPLPRPARPSF